MPRFSATDVGTRDAGLAGDGLHDGRMAAFVCRKGLSVRLPGVLIAIGILCCSDRAKNEAWTEAFRDSRQEPRAKVGIEAGRANARGAELLTPVLRMTRFRLRELQKRSLRTGSRSASASAV